MKKKKKKKEEEEDDEGGRRRRRPRRRRGKGKEGREKKSGMNYVRKRRPSDDMR